MRIIFIIFNFLLIPDYFAQFTSQEQYEIDSHGNDDVILFINGDSIKPVKNYYKGVLTFKGQMIKTEKNRWSQYGLSEYWYMNGKKKLESYSSKHNLPTKYINMWNEKGEQLLKNGNGYYYSWESDSVLYTVRDSLLDGVYTIYEKNETGSYFISEKGLCMFGKKNGMYNLYDEEGNLKAIGNYLDDFENGNYQEYYSNKNIKLSGTIQKQSQIGKWYYWDENENLTSIKQFYEDDLRIDCVEYYINKKKKNEGTFVYSTDTITTFVEDELGELTIPAVIVEQVEEKIGQWIYYSDDGKTERIEVYNKSGELISTKKIE